MTPATTADTIGAYMMEHADGRPIAYVDAAGLAVYTYQQPDGAYTVEVYTHDDATADRLRLLVDGCLMNYGDRGDRPRPCREPPW
jgi:hypothetical protein